MCPFSLVLGFRHGVVVAGEAPWTAAAAGELGVVGGFGGGLGKDSGFEWRRVDSGGGGDGSGVEGSGEDSVAANDAVLATFSLHCWV